MPVFDVTAPDGKVFEVNTPEGGTEQDAIRYLASTYNPELNDKSVEGGYFTDLMKSGASGVLTGIRGIIDVLGAENPISQKIKGGEEYLAELLSAQAKKENQKIAEIFERMDNEGTLEQFMSALEAFSVAPSRLIVQGLGTSVPFLIGGLLGAGARTIASLGAAQGVGITKDAIYQATKEELLNAKVSEDEAERIAQEAQSYAGKNIDQLGLGALTGLLGSVTGIERRLIPSLSKNVLEKSAKKSILRRTGETAITEAVPEFFQGGQERLSQNIALQREGFETPTMQGVFGQGAFEAFVGAGLGAGVGAVTPGRASTETPTPPVPPAPPAPSIEFEQEAPVGPPPAETRVPIPGIQADPTGLTARDFLTSEQVRLQRQQQVAQQFGLYPPNTQAAKPAPAPFALPSLTPQVPPQVAPAVSAALAQQRLEGQQAAAQQFPDLFAPTGTLPPLATPKVADVTPSQVPLRPSVTPGIPQPLGDADRTRIEAVDAEATDRKATIDRLRQQAETDPTEQGRQTALLTLGQMLQTPAQPRFIELQPMRLPQATARLNVLKSESPSANLNVVAHPSIPNAFAIEDRPVAPLEPETEAAPSFAERRQQALENQQRIELAAMRAPTTRAPEEEARQVILNRALQNIEERGGVASPAEAQLLQEAKLGTPYDRIDPGLAPQGTVDQRLTDATGIALQPRPREAVTEPARQERQQLEDLIKETGQPAPLPDPNRVIEALRTPTVARSAEQVSTVNLARSRYAPSDIAVLERAADGTMTSEDASRLDTIEQMGARFNLSDEVSPETKAIADEVRKKLLPALKKFGLGNVALRLLDTIDGGKANGAYLKQVISIALDSDNPMGVMRHEVIHALKELGAFTDAELKVLSKRAREEWINRFIGPELVERYRQIYSDQNDGNMEGFQEYIEEEGIAEAFKHFDNNKPPAGMIANLMRRLNNMFQAIKEFFGAQGLTAEDIFLSDQIFRDIEAGRLQQGRGASRTPGGERFSKKFDETGDITPLTVQSVRVYNRELESLVKKIGDRIAGMKSDKTIDDVRKAVKKLQDYTARGLKGREWYENSANAILEAFDGDTVLAEKLFQIIAITSANTEVAANFTKATNAWSQFTNDKPIKVGTSNENKKIEALLFFGVDWEGRKTNTFYTNLMEAMDGKDSGRSTIDLHMTRMIFDQDAPTDAQYELAENMVRLLASKLNIPPRQVQAASWVTQKAKTMFEDYRKKGWKKNLNDDELRQFAFERAVTDYSHLMKAKVKQLKVIDSLKEPSPAIRARVQNITGEAVPSKRSEMSELEDLSFADKERFTKEVERSNAIKTMANILGITSRVRVTIGSGAYEGKVNPNMRIQVVNNDPVAAENDARDLALAMSYVFKQDATPFFRADPSLIGQQQFGVQLKFGKAAITPTQQNKILQAFAKVMGPDAGFSRISANEIVVINYRGEDGQPFLMTDEAFAQAIDAASEEINNIAPIDGKTLFGAKSEYPYHDWTADPNGISLIERIQTGRPERSDIQRGLNRIRESFVSTARDAVKRAGGTPRFSLRPDQVAFRPSDSGGRGIAFNDVKPDAKTYIGSHYGNARVNILNGKRYGTGLKGAEASRLSQSSDPRIRSRVYFYIPRFNDTMPPRESGTGSFVYSQKLSNVLGPGETMSRLYREASGDANTFESSIIDSGYDGYAVPDYGMMVVLNNDVPVKFEGTVADLASREGTPKFSLRPTDQAPKAVTKTEPFKRWFGKSKIVDTAGNPKVMYHGTARDIEEFRGKQVGAIFVTDDPVFAETFGDMSETYMAEEYFNNLNQNGRKKFVQEVLKTERNVLKQQLKDKEIDRKSFDGYMAKLDLFEGRFDREGYPETFNGIPGVLDVTAIDLAKDRTPSRANILPLYIKAEKPFDYANPDHVNEISQDLIARIGKNNVEIISRGSWTTIETPEVQRAIREAGFDGFYVLEAGRKNLAVYNPNQIKSATGNIGTFDDTGRIRYNLVEKPENAPPQLLTKTAPVQSAGKAIQTAVRDTFDTIQDNDYWTKKRMEWVDQGSALTQRLSDLPLYDPNGTLRADMLKHAQAQVLNLIRTGIGSGTPFLNRDGTLSIQRSENNFSRSEILADALNTNPNVVKAGVSGKQYVAEIARALRGKDIIEEDKRLNALGIQQLEEAKSLYKEAKQSGKDGNFKRSRALLRQVARLRKEGYKNKAMKRELQVTPEQIKWAEEQLQNTPEVQGVLDIWKNINTSLIDLWEKVGLLSPESAQEYRDTKNYVPLFKSRDDLNNEKTFALAGVGAKTTAKLKKLEGSESIRNIWENLDKQYATMIAAAYENQTRRISVQQLEGLGGAQRTNISDPRGNLKFKENGQDVNVIVENPNVQLAFQTFSHEVGPVMKAFGSMTRVLRAGALINPMFWLRQLVRDPIHATLVADSGVITPFHAAGNFIQELAKGSPEGRLLAERGVIGQMDSTVDMSEFLTEAGRDRMQKPGVMQKTLHRLLQIHEASDAATRIAVFKRVKAKALKDGMSEEQAIDFAVFKARESINFSVKGMHPFLSSLRQMIPFINATIVGLDTLYRAATGYGLNPEERKEAMRQFRIKAGVMVGFATAYAMMYANDDDYNKLPDYVKDNNFLIPIGTGEDRNFIKLAIPYEVGFLFKTVPEVLVRYLSGNSTGKEMLASYWGGLLHNLPTGGTPIPQAVRPGLEVITNYSFFTGRPIEGMSDQGLPKAMRGDRASEFAKVLSRVGLDKLNLSPAQIDYLMQGYFAELGTFSTEMASSILSYGQGKNPPEKNLYEMPFFRSFMTNPNSDKAVADFFEVTQTAQEVSRAFTDMANLGKTEEARAYLQTDENRMLVGVASTLRSIRDDMSEIRQQIRFIRESAQLSPEEKNQQTKRLQDVFNTLARRGVEISDSLGIR